MDDYLDYQHFVDTALLGVVKTALRQVANNDCALLGEHYFYITFKTQCHGVVVPDFLREKYPESLTVIIQHEFSNLSVNDHEFGITLSFNSKNYHLIIPFHSIMSFNDPSVGFTLSFTPQDEFVHLVEDEPTFAFKDAGDNIISLADYVGKQATDKPDPDVA
jgi:hypothetical protein